MALVEPSAALPQETQFPLSVKKTKLCLSGSKETDMMYDIPNRIVARLTRECGGNVHDRRVVAVMCGSFKDEHQLANRHPQAVQSDFSGLRRMPLIWILVHVSV
jgi:hypothetical protein